MQARRDCMFSVVCVFLGVQCVYLCVCVYVRVVRVCACVRIRISLLTVA